MPSNSKFYLTVLALLALTLLIFLGLDIYNIRTQNEETSRLLNLADESAGQEILIQSIRLFQNNAREDITAFEDVVLTDNRLVPVIEAIEEAGQTLGLEAEIVSVDKSDDKKEEEFQKIKLVVETKGSWDATFLFLRALENLPNRVEIEDARLTKEGSSWQSRSTILLYSFD